MNIIEATNLYGECIFIVKTNDEMFLGDDGKFYESLTESFEEAIEDNEASVVYNYTDTATDTEKVIMAYGPTIKTHDNYGVSAYDVIHHSYLSNISTVGSNENEAEDKGVICKPFDDESIYIVIIDWRESGYDYKLFSELDKAQKWLHDELNSLETQGSFICLFKVLSTEGFGLDIDTETGKLYAYSKNSCDLIDDAGDHTTAGENLWQILEAFNLDLSECLYQNGTGDEDYTTLMIPSKPIYTHDNSAVKYDNTLPTEYIVTSEGYAIDNHGEHFKCTKEGLLRGEFEAPSDDLSKKVDYLPNYNYTPIARLGSGIFDGQIYKIFKEFDLYISIVGKKAHLHQSIDKAWEWSKLALQSARDSAALRTTISNLGFKTHKDFCKSFGIDQAYLSTTLNSVQTMPNQFKNIIRTYHTAYKKGLVETPQMYVKCSACDGNGVGFDSQGCESHGCENGFIKTNIA